MQRTKNEIIFTEGELTEARMLKDRLVAALKNFFLSAGKKNAVVGLSGGVDSATACGLLAEALGPKQVFAYYLPVDNDAKDGKDAANVAKKFKLNLKTINLKPLVGSACKLLGAKDRIGRGNLSARMRMIALYQLARKHNALVTGTGNRTESLLGYFTKYGDGGADVLPLGDLYKTQVWAVASILGVPKEVVAKKPSAGLWRGQTDERELGMSYAEMDLALEGLFDRKKNERELNRLVGANKVKRVSQLFISSSHKRSPPFVLKVRG